MNINLTLISAIALVAGAADAASPDPAVVAILRADRLAVGGPDAQAATAEFAFAGMGLTGKVVSITDLKTGRFLDTMAAGPMTEAEGFDGVHAWSREPSGTVTTQDGGDQHALAVNEAYRRSNAWWRADLGGAQIASLGRKQDAGGAAYDVIAVTPAGGKMFEAWFGAGDHLLDRVIEAQGSKSLVTVLSDYREVNGAKLAGTTTIDGGDGAKYVQTLTLVSAHFGDAAPTATFAVPKTETADAAIGGGATQTVMPFTLINNHVYGQATIDGKGPYRFIFDTGGVNLVTPSLAKTLGLATKGQFAGSGAGEGTMEVGFTKVAELKVADATIRDQSFYVLPLDSLSKVEGIEEQGMIGYETFRRFVTRFDYGAHTVTLIDPKRFDPKDAGTPIHFDFNENNPEISGTFEGIPGKFDIDTGSRSELTLNKPFAERNGLRAKHPKGMDMVDGWGIGGPSRGYVTRGASLTLGPVEVKGVVTTLTTQSKGAFAADNYQGNIGGGVLKRFVVTFDYEHQTMYLKPIAEPVEEVGTFDRAGMWFNVAGDGFEVVDVTAGGPADTAGIKAGDHLVAIDGEPAAKTPIYELRRRLRNAAPRSVLRFSVVRAGQTTTVAVTLRDLI